MNRKQIPLAVLLIAIAIVFFSLGCTTPGPSAGTDANDDSSSANDSGPVAVTNDQALKSPFGVFSAYSYTEFNYFLGKTGMSGDEYIEWADNHMKNIGAHWTRSNLQLLWDAVEPELGKGYVWDNSFAATDKLITSIYDSEGKMNWLGVFQTGAEKKNINGKTTTGRDPLEYPEEFKAFVKAVVERYDGDGVDDASPNVKVKYWQAGNENMQWTTLGRTAEQYAEFVRLLREAAKEADPEAKIVLISSMDGRNTDPFLNEAIEELAPEKEFDAIDLHYWSRADGWKMPAVDAYKTLLDSKGLSDVEIWSCEQATWVGQPKGETSIQTETQQATSLVKRYTYNLAHGLDKLMWTIFVEWENFNGNPENMFNFMGLIADGSGAGEDPAMLNIPRLSYYSYKLMTQKLEGSNWDNIEKVSESGGKYAYKFTKPNGDTVWVAWLEASESSSSTATLNLDVGDASKVIVTKAVPNEESGKYISDFDSAIEYMEVSASGGTVNVSLFASAGPVYIEDASTSNKDGKKVSAFTIIEEDTSGTDEGDDTGAMTEQECMKNCVEVEGKMPAACVEECGIETTGGTTNTKCGDGKCDDLEKANNLCPKDCSATTGTGGTTPAQPSCGDGICGPREQSGEVSCPADCS